MKTTSAFSCILLTLPAAADGEREALIALAREKQTSVLQVGPGEVVVGGCFISEDGLALCPLQGVLPGTSPPLVSAYEGLRSEPAGIRAVFRDPNLALLQLDHRPKAWLPLATGVLEPGTMVAILDPAHGEPVAVGPVTGFRKSLEIQNKRVVFEQRFSIASCLRGGPGNPPVQGLPVVNGDGKLVGFLWTAVPNGLQTMIYALPIASAIERIAEAREKDTRIAIPLPAELDPFDPAGRDPDLSKAAIAMGQREYERADELALTVLRKHPGSRLESLKTESRPK